MTHRIGIIGVGEIAEAIVDGWRRVDLDAQIFLSPRNSGTAARLAAESADVEVCSDNQEVVDRSDIVLLTVGAPVASDVLANLTVPQGHTVISAVAGLSCADLAALLPEKPTVVRVIPLPAVRSGRGITAVFPHHRVTEQLFEVLGTTIVADTETQFSALSAATASISSHLTYLATISGWLRRQGWELADAERFVREMYTGLGPALVDPYTPLADLVLAHETPAGINEALRKDWIGDDDRARLEQALGRILTRVTTPRDVQ
ncbi:NAD(P)-binding domain-containing protein [Gordonia soli]|uniref:Pyrroline-5-carboxylate reductase catalytic N-terminal domain-containing protein n=1 Tax=Gordonia soli NBRC 108243 TaxID=1223545 RepID=M0QGL9_9ACTN|nr:NAD(P)-binding domain-containing protein [Gordonia soli]GAC67431.1 hypothetical protein GS4_08_00150 [Gordonia soli NBRC 108243]